MAFSFRSGARARERSLCPPPNGTGARRSSRTRSGPFRPSCEPVFELSYWHELVRQEIAEALGVPVGTVAVRFSRATEKLRHLLLADDAG